MANEQPFDELLQLIARLAAKRWLREQREKQATSLEADVSPGRAFLSEEAKQAG